MRILALLLLTLSAAAQTPTRSVVLSWTASTSTSVTGYSVYSCTVAAPASSCTPSLTGTPVTTSGTTLTLSEPVNAAYGYSVVANAPACTSSTPVGTACGNSSPLTVGFVPVLPQPASGSNVVVVVP